MNKTELVSAIAQKTGMTKKDTKLFLDTFVETVTAQLAEGDKIQLVGFGSFYVKKRAERTGTNPQTRDTLVIPSALVPKFKAGKELKDAVNK